MAKLLSIVLFVNVLWANNSCVVDSKVVQNLKKMYTKERKGMYAEKGVISYKEALVRFDALAYVFPDCMKNLRKM